MKLKEGSNGGYSMLTTFTAPMVVKQTSNVVKDGSYDQWLKMGYLAKGKKWRQEQGQNL